MSKQSASTGHQPTVEPERQPRICCSPLATQALGTDQADELASRFKALSDPIRLRLLSMIASAENGEICVCDLTTSFDVSGPTISHHLRVLREAGLVDCERRGTWVYYRPRRTDLHVLSTLLRAADTTAEATDNAEGADVPK